VSQQFNTIEWDVTKLINRPGDYVFTFNYDSGAHGLMIRNVALLANGKEISRDQHTGWAGYGPHDTAYTLKIPQRIRGAKYTLQAEAISDGGTDSTGTIYVKQPPKR
jgi:hexosaminidase